MGTIRRVTRPQRGPDRRPAVDVGTPETTPAGDSAARWRDFLFQFAVIVLACLWIYAPVCNDNWRWDPRFNQFVHRTSPKQGDVPIVRDQGGDWLWDDDQLLTQNLTVQHRVTPDPRVPADTWATLVKLWTSPEGADYFPLSYTALWMQWPFFGMNSFGYHVTTILLHIAGALLFWRLLHVMQVPGAWLGGLLFAIHPVCVETVGWVSEIKNTLSQPLFMLACTAFVQFDEERDGSRAAKFYVLAVVLFLFTMFAKTAVVMFPFLILAYGWWKHGFVVDRRGVTTLLLAGASLALTVVPEMVWLKALRDGVSTWTIWTTCGVIALVGPLASVALAIFAMAPQRAVGGSSEAGGRKTLEQYTLYALPFFWISAVLGLATCYFQWSRAIGQEAIPVGGVASRIATAGMAILFYLWKTIWPFNLLTIYPKWQVDPPQVWQFLPWPMLIAAGWWLWGNRGTAEKPTWQRHVLFVAAFFLLMLLPILGFITISYMRITWVADHFLYTPMIAVLGLLAAAIATWYSRAQESERPAALAVGAILLAVLGYSSFRYAHAWVDEEALWPHTIAGHPNPCHQGCGCWQAHNRLGAKKFAKGDLEAAHYHFQNSTRLRPDLGETHNNLGTTHSARSQMAAQQGNQEAAKREMDLAIEQFREACRVTPHVPATQVNYANSLAAAGRFADAADQYKALLEKIPKEAALWNNYGVALFKQGDNERAIAAFRQALALNPNLKDAQESLAVATGEKAGPTPPPGGQLQLQAPLSPTLGPAPLAPR